MTPAALHEQHKARVLGLGFGRVESGPSTTDATGLPPVMVTSFDGPVLPPRQHHDEATDALIVGALEAAVVAIHIGHGGVPAGQAPSACPKCDALTKIHLALRALGK